MQVLSSKRVKFIIPGIILLISFLNIYIYAAADYDYHDYGTYGPIVGAVSPNSVKVYYRPVEFGEGDTLILEYSEVDNPGNTKVVKDEINEILDYVAHFEIKGLEPNTEYNYIIKRGNQVLAGDSDHPVSFKTFVDKGAVMSFRFVVFADMYGFTPLQNRRDPEYKPFRQDWVGTNCYRNTVDEDFNFGDTGVVDKPVFFLQIGDWDHRDPGRYITEDFKFDIYQWRRMHRDVMYNLPSGQDFHKYIAPNMPIYHTWDDHDYGEDDIGANAPYKNIATKAFLEYFPVPEFAYKQGRICYSFRYAQAEFFMLDTRSFRVLDRENPEKGTMLGEQQLSWLKNKLASSTARWKFIISSSTWNKLSSKQADNWNDFNHEREEIIQFCEKNNIIGIIIISGDIHSGGAFDNGAYCYNPNKFPEISVPHTNNFSGMPHSGIGQTCKQKSGTIPQKEMAGSWDFFMPGAYINYKRYPYDPGLYFQEIIYSGGYVVIEVHHGSLIKEYNAGVNIKNDRTLSQPEIASSYPPLDWVTVKFISAPLHEDFMLRKIENTIKNPIIEIEKPKIIYETTIY